MKCKFCGLELKEDDDKLVGLCEWCMKKVIKEEEEYNDSK